MADQKITIKQLSMTTARLLGRVTAGSGIGEELTGTQVTALLDSFTAALKGLVPASGGGTANFLRADGSWSVPPNSGGTVTSVSVASANGVTGTSSGGTTPALTIALGAITPTSVASTGAVSGTTGGFSSTVTGTDLITTTGLLKRSDGNAIINSPVSGSTSFSSFGSGVYNFLKSDNTSNLVTISAAGALTAVGAIAASNFSGSHTGTSSGTNTGDQTITLTGAVTGSGTGSFATTIAASPALTGVPTSTTAAVDTNTTQIATTAYVIGQSYLKTATAASTYASLASPSLTGVPVAPTAAVDTNTTQLATTAYVIGQSYLKIATATSTYAPLASPSLTGTPVAPTAAVNTSTTQLATTAFVIGQANSTAGTITMNGAQAAGASALYARADHVHPTDTSLAPTASPTFTGTVNAAALNVNGNKVITNATYLNNAFGGGSSSIAAPFIYDAASGNVLTNYSNRLTITDTGAASFTSITASTIFTRQIDFPASELTSAVGLTYADGVVIVKTYYNQPAQLVRVRFWNANSLAWSGYTTLTNISTDPAWAIYSGQISGNYLTKLQIEVTAPVGNTTNVIAVEYFPTRDNGGIRYPTMFAQQGADQLTFGGGKSNHVSLRRVNQTLQVRLADDSGDAAITAGTITGSGAITGSNLSGTNTGDQTITLTGDITGSGTGSFASTIAAGAVTLSKQANLAAYSIIGNNSGAGATPLALTGTQVTAMLDSFTAALKGLVPASGGGTANFLRADGSWATPGVWGTITGTLSNQTDLQTALNAKSNLSGGNTFSGNQTFNNTITVLGNSPTFGTNLSGSDNILQIANPGIGSISGFNLARTNDAAGISVNEYASDATLYEFWMSDNPDQAQDMFQWRYTDWQGANGLWTPFRMGGVQNTHTATSHQFYGNISQQSTAFYTTGDPTNATPALRNIQNYNTLSKLGVTIAGTVSITGLDISGYTGASGSVVFIKAEGATTFQWGYGAAGGTATQTAVPFTTGLTTLSNGIKVSFSATTGAVAGDVWQFRAYMAATNAIGASTFSGNVSVTGTLASTGAVSGSNLTGTNTGDQTITLTGNVTGSGTGSFATAIATNAVTLANMAQVATGTVFYRKTAATGNPEVQTLATLKTDLGLTGTNTGDQTITLTGDVTGTGTGSFAATVAAGSITLAKQANLAANSIQGNNTGSAATPLALTGTQVTAMLDLATGGLKGLMASSDFTKLAGVAVGATANSTDAYLLSRANHTGTQAWSTITATPTTLGGYGITDAINVSQKAAVNGVASLDGTGKIPTSQLPAIALTTVSVVGSQAAQLALTVQAGDVAVRTDLNKSYVNNGGSAGTMADWQELLTPTDSVLSVNGYTGAVTLTKTDVGLGNVDNTSDVNKPVSTAQQTALNLKANLAGAAFTSAVSVAGVLTATGGALSQGVTPARFENTNSSPVTGASGTGLDVFQNAGSVYVRSYNVTTPGYTPLQLVGSTISVSPAGTTVGAFSSTGLAVTGTVSATSTISASNFSGTSSGTNTGDETYSTITTKVAGGSGGGTTNFLRADGTFAIPVAQPTPVMAFAPVIATGTGVSQGVTIPQSGLATTDIMVFINGIYEQPSNYTIAGTTVTLTTDFAGDSITIIKPFSGTTFIGFKVSVSGVTIASEKYTTTSEVAFTANTTSSAKALTAATATTVFTVKKGTIASPTTVGTFTFSAAGTVAAVSITAGAIASGDIVWIEAPATPDATLADIVFTLRA